MRYYLDTEFNSFLGELISLALVPADPSLPSFYVVVPWAKPTDPWVAQHVVPHLGAAPVARETAAQMLGLFLRSADASSATKPVVVADWPTDFEHLLALLITGPGQMEAVPEFSMEFRPLPGFNTASTSKTPHNALADAEALRDYCEGRA